MPSLIQRFARARNPNGNGEPLPRPQTAAEELTTPSDVASPDSSPKRSIEAPGVRVVIDDSSAAAHESRPTEGRGETDGHKVAVEEDGKPADGDDEQDANHADAIATAAAELKKARQKAKAAAALQKMKAQSGFSLWRWLPTFYDPVEDTIRSRIIAVLAVAVIPAMLVGLLLEPMITDTVAVTSNKVLVFSPLFMPLDPVYVGVLPAKGFEFRFVVRNVMNWPQSGKLPIFCYEPCTPLCLHTPNPCPRRHSIRLHTSQLHCLGATSAASSASVRPCSHRHCALLAGWRVQRHAGRQYRAIRR
jgi:hypothetical protein